MMPGCFHRYMLCDSQNEPLAPAFLETPPESKVWRFRLEEADLPHVLEHEVLNLISADTDCPNVIARLLSSNYVDAVEVEPLNEGGTSLRQNLWVPVRFDSFIYPVSGSWVGRVPIVCHDLSCGGLAFFCNFTLNIGEVVEIVIPITSQPVLLQARILHLRPSNSNIPLYAAAFVDLIHDEEVILREAVFSQQLANHSARSQRPSPDMR